MKRTIIAETLACIILFAGTLGSAKTESLPGGRLGDQDTTPPYTVMSIGGPTYQSGGTDRVNNGGFESDLSGWVTSGLATIEEGVAHSGSKNLKLGPGTASAYQTISISEFAYSVKLTFWYKLSAYVAYTGCEIRSSGGSILVVPFSTSSGTVSEWTKFTVDITRFKGETIRIYFYSSSSIYTYSTLWIDDVSVKEDESVWIRNNNSLRLIARDDLSGLDYKQYSINTV
ncbi:MAG: hypothetical protein ACUVRS_12385 [Armatimonadota bacterium]